MHVRWYGQSAFHLATGGRAVFLDPFHLPDAERAARGIRIAYPPIRDAQADLLLITHEHFDHNAAEAVGGDPLVIRSTAGTLDSPLGRVTAIASEHDPEAGTRRGPNTIFVLECGGLRVCHCGDFGQTALRPEQRRAVGRVDLLLLPVGGGPTVGADGALELVRQMSPRWVVPMHYRTPALNFLEPADAFLARFERVHRCATSAFCTTELPPAADPPLVVLPAVPA